MTHNSAKATGDCRSDTRTSSVDVATAPRWQRYRSQRAAAADKGDAGAAQELMTLVAVAMRAGLPVPIELARWLTTLLAAPKAAQALLRAAGKTRMGRPPKGERDEALMARIVLRSRRNGGDMADAKRSALGGQVDGGRVFDQRVLDKIVASYAFADRWALSLLSDAELEALGAEDSDPPSRQ